ncbi:MAG: DnaT-like ssDNA-binding protein [Methanosphaera sp.]|nr:DnaT-like ssDNA-binding protein [Methanosphaera sp.]
MSIILVVGENCYFDVAEANQMIEQRFMTTDKEYIEWNKLSDDNKSIVIFRNTETFEMKIWYRGDKASRSNPLEWPRIVNGKYTECPEEVKLGILMNGVKALVEASLDNSDISYHSLLMNGIKEYKIKDASITLKDSANINILKEYEKLKGNDSIYKNVVTKYFTDWLKVVV